MKKPEYYDLVKGLTNGLVISIDGEKHKTALSYLTEIWQKLKFPGTHINWGFFLSEEFKQNLNQILYRGTIRYGQKAKLSKLKH